MPSIDDIPVCENVTIPGHELWLEFSRSSGPGGQHVNKTSTRVSLCWALEQSGALDRSQKERAKVQLRGRLTGDGILRVTSDRHRSQSANRREVRGRLADIMADALRKPKRRVPTRPTRASQKRRIESKKRRGHLKQERRTVDW